MVERLGLGRAQPGRGVRLGPGELPVLDLLGRRLLRLALLLAVGVDEGVGQDPVEPGLEVGARRVNWWKAANALAKVSWTRSSASAGLRVIRSAAAYSWSRKGSASRSKRAARSSAALLDGDADRPRRSVLEGLGHRVAGYRPASASRADDGRSTECCEHAGVNASPARLHSRRQPSRPAAIRASGDPRRSVQRLVLASAAPGCGTSKPWSAPRDRDDVEASGASPRGDLARAAERVALALDDQRRHARRRRARRPRLRSGRPGGCSGKASATHRDGADVAARCGRPPGRRRCARRPRAGRRGRSVACAAAAATASQAASSVAGGAATLRPATRHGCSTSTTVTPARGSARGQRRQVAGVDAAAGAVAEHQRRDRRRPRRRAPSRASPCGVRDRPTASLDVGHRRRRRSAVGGVRRAGSGSTQLGAVVAHVVDRGRHRVRLERPGRRRAPAAPRSRVGVVDAPGRASRPSGPGSTISGIRSWMWPSVVLGRRW